MRPRGYLQPYDALRVDTGVQIGYVGSAGRYGCNMGRNQDR